MSDKGSGIAEIVKDARYLPPAIGIIILGLLVITAKDRPNWIKIFIPGTIAYVIGAGIISWSHASRAYLLEDEVGPVTEANRSRYVERKRKQVNIANTVHVVWAVLVLGATIYTSWRHYP